MRLAAVAGDSLGDWIVLLGLAGLAAGSDDCLADWISKA